MIVIFSIVPSTCIVILLHYQGGRWTSYHIDELMPSKCDIPDISELKETSVSSLFESGVEQKPTAGDNNAEVRDQDKMNFNIFNEEGEKEMELDEDHDSDLTGRGLHPSAIDVEVDMDDDTCSGGQPSNDELRNKLTNMDIGEVEVHVSELMEYSGASNLGAGEQYKRKLVAETLHHSREAIVSEKNKLDVDRLIMNCLHSATSMLKDREELSSRKTHRVQLLMKLLQIRKGVPVFPIQCDSSV